MGLAVAGEVANSSENSGPDETEVGNEDESIVHHTASVGDAEVLRICYSCRLLPFWPLLNNFYQTPICP